ncbi:MAG: methyl-accepting chemotaxis protein [Bdellovibrionales bacterium]
MTIRQQHNHKMNKLFLIALSLHIPVFAYQSLLFEKPMWFTLASSLFLLSLPAFLFFTKTAEKILPSVMAFTTICYSALLIHLAGGMIEMHFHIFVSLATFVAYGLLSPVLVGVVVTAAHHLGFFFFLPTSVFNYEASLGIVLLHALFVVVEAVPTLFIASQFKKMIDLQDTSLGTLNSVTNEITESLRVIHGTGEALAEHSSSTAASVQETSASIEELNSMVKLNTQNAVNASELAQASTQAAQSGTEEFKKLLLAMKNITKSSQQIQEITTIIDDLAFQTNLLALNAAVEAARAGEQGRGFSVVAEAVRNLAQKSATAAKDISKLIQESAEHVQFGLKSAESSDKAIHSILNNIEKMAELNKQISHASVEQTTGITQINIAVGKIDHSAQSQAQSSAEISRMTEHLHTQSETVKKLVQDVNEKIGGSQRFSSKSAA